MTGIPVGRRTSTGTPELDLSQHDPDSLAGSQNDAEAWKTSRVVTQRDMLLQDDEWVWADTAYPVWTWCRAPYMKYVQLCFLP